MSPATLSQVLNGHAKSWSALRQRLAEHLGIPEPELFPPPGVAELVAESRRRQGLPPKVTDPATLAKMATLLAEAAS